MRWRGDVPYPKDDFATMFRYLGLKCEGGLAQLPGQPWS